MAVTLKTFGDKTESRHCYQFATEWGCFVIVCHLTVINPWESQTCGHLHAQKSPLINSDIVASGRLLPGNAFMVIIVTSAVAVNATQQREALLPH